MLGAMIPGPMGKGKVISSFWTGTKNRTSVMNAYLHYKKHKNEFPELQNAVEYVKEAKKFLNNSSKNILTKVKANGDTLMYNPVTNTFGVKNINGVPRTMFKPKKGIEYWKMQ